MICAYLTFDSLVYARGEFDLRTWGRSGAEARSNGGGAGLPELGRPQRGCFFVTAVISSRAQRTVLDSEAVTLS